MMRTWPPRRDPPILGNLDYPVAGQTASRVLPVKGWCFSPAKKRLTATLRLNGAPARVLPVDAPRPDVSHTFAHMDIGERCGFSDQLACDTLPFVDGVVVVSIDVRDAADCELTLGPVAVRLADETDFSVNTLSSEQETWLYHDRIEFCRSDAEIAAHVRLRADIQATDVVLEIGCGAGRIARQLAPWCRRWIGIDISPAVLENARARLAGFQNVELIQNNGYDLSTLPGNSIDVVYCSLVFMLLPEWDRFNYVAAAYRVLKPSGRLYVETMNLLGDESWKIFSRLSRLTPHLRPPNVCRTATPQELETYFMRAGFQAIEAVSGAIVVECVGKKR
jgi:ubiquinone/menaquinone biosynthesis C-methylase UbiE